LAPLLPSIAPAIAPVAAPTAAPVVAPLCSSGTVAHPIIPKLKTTNVISVNILNLIMSPPPYLMYVYSVSNKSANHTFNILLRKKAVLVVLAE
jgi:hypothetical protein